MNTTDRYDSLFQWYASLSGVDWLLLKAQVKQESGFNPNARSDKGAMGLAQFMPRTWAEWCDGTPGIQSPAAVNPVLLSPYNPEHNIRAQAAYMAWLLKHYQGDNALVLAAYNWGCGDVDSLRVNSCATFDQIAPRTPPETQNYVRRILASYEEYQQVIQMPNFVMAPEGVTR